MAKHYIAKERIYAVVRNYSYDDIFKLSLYHL